MRRAVDIWETGLSIAIALTVLALSIAAMDSRALGYEVAIERSFDAKDNAESLGLIDNSSPESHENHEADCAVSHSANCGAASGAILRWTRDLLLNRNLGLRFGTGSECFREQTTRPLLPPPRFGS